MKIDNAGKTLQSPLTRSSSSRTAASQAASVTQQESVSINPLAAQLQAMETDSASASFDADKVAAIRQAIADGKFSVRADAIADKLLASVQDLLKE